MSETLLEWISGEIDAREDAMRPIDPEFVGYADMGAYQEWCRLKAEVGRLKTIREHIRALGIGSVVEVSGA